MLPEREVKDRFFAYVLGIVIHDVTREIPQSHMARLLPEYTADGDIPFQRIRSISRKRISGRERLIETSFSGEFAFPFPFTFFGIPVGSVRTSGYLALNERIVGNAGYRNDSGATMGLRAVHELRLEAGRLFIDFRPWIDLILGRFVEDVEIVAALIFRHDGTWYALAAGRDPKGRIHAGGYNFAEDSGMIPVPKRFRGIAKRLAAQQPGKAARP